MTRMRTVLALAAVCLVGGFGCTEMAAQSQQKQLTDAIVEVGKAIAAKSNTSQFTGTVTGSVVDPSYTVSFDAGVGVIGHMVISSSGVNLQGSAAVNAAATQPVGDLDMRSYDQKASDQRMKTMQGVNAILAGDAQGINDALAKDYTIIVLKKNAAATATPVSAPASQPVKSP